MLALSGGTYRLWCGRLLHLDPPLQTYRPLNRADRSSSQRFRIGRCCLARSSHQIWLVLGIPWSRAFTFERNVLLRIVDGLCRLWGNMKVLSNPAFERTRISVVGMRVTASVCWRLRSRRSTRR